MLLEAGWQRLQFTYTAAARRFSTLAERIGRDLLQAQPQDLGDAARHKVCHVGLIGFPNAGKSQLTNQLTGVKVTAVSPKAHTTRAPQLGAFTVKDTQVVLHDTPGFADASAFGTGTPGRLQRVKSAWQTAQQCDVLLFIVDAEAQYRFRKTAIFTAAEALTAGPPPRLFSRLEWSPIPTALVLNKIDLLPAAAQKLVLDVLAHRLKQHHPFDRCFNTSALRGLGVPPLRRYLLSKAAPGAWELSSSQSTDKGPAELAAEVVREKLYQLLYNQVPYTLEPLPDKHIVLLDGTHLIRLVLPVESVSVKKIVVGAKGQLLQEAVVARAQQELQQLLGATVKLSVEVVLLGP